MNLVAFLLIIFGCCYSTNAQSNDKNDSPLMWLLIRQLERTSDDFKKIENQMKETDNKVDSLGKHMQRLRNDTDNIEYKMDKKIKTILEPIYKSLRTIQTQSISNANKFNSQITATNKKVDSLEKNVESLRVKMGRVQTGIDVDRKALQSVKQSLQTHSGSNTKTFKDIYLKLSLLTNSVEHLKTFLECQTGWKEWNGHCYFFGAVSLNWAKAKLSCGARRSHLVKIETSQENKMLHSEIRKMSGTLYWIGANDIAKEGTWVWESDGTAVSYSSWAPSQPKNYGSSNVDCGYLFRYNTLPLWEAGSCGSANNMYFICEKKLVT